MLQALPISLVATIHRYHSWLHCWEKLFATVHHSVFNPLLLTTDIIWACMGYDYWHKIHVLNFLPACACNTPSCSKRGACLPAAWIPLVSKQLSYSMASGCMACLNCRQVLLCEKVLQRYLDKIFIFKVISILQWDQNNCNTCSFFTLGIL